jgi:hypothetical protein
VERIEAQGRVRAALAHHLADPLGGVRADQPHLPAALGAERVEEAGQGLLVVPGGRPDQAARVVVHDHHQVPMPALERDLINPDPAQAVERVVRRAGVGEHPGDDPADRSPGDAQQLADRGLRRVRDQPRGGVLERGGVPRSMPGPRHLDHRWPVLRAGHPRRGRLQEHLDRA